MLLRKQSNFLYQKLTENGLQPTDFNIHETVKSYTLELKGTHFRFHIAQKKTGFDLDIIPHDTVTLDQNWYDWDEIEDCFSEWAHALGEDATTPDLWAEAAKTAQLFAPTSTPTDDKFTRTELAEVQGQLRLLQQSFTTAALPEAARQKLIELTQTAAVKAEGLTKKDWQNWLIGGFISAIASLALNPTQAGEVLKLVKAAFGGLFLH